MHVPDGVLSPAVCAAAGAVSLGAVGYSLHRLRADLSGRAIPLTGMTAAVIFAGQMVNFPIGLLGIPQVSGHLLGGVLAAVLVGPWAGCIAMALVLTVQCLMFADGGLLALGVNVLNMGVLGAWGGYAVVAQVRRRLGDGPRGTLVGSVLAAWLTVTAAAALFCIEFRLSWPSGEYRFGNIFALMATVHAAIGVGEAVITGGIVGFVLTQRPELLSGFTSGTDVGPRFSTGRIVAVGCTVALSVAAFLAPFASPHDDGLEAVAAKEFAVDRSVEAGVWLLNDYAVPSPFAGWADSPLWAKVSVSLAGVLGTLTVLAAAALFDRSLKSRLAVEGVQRDG